MFGIGIPELMMIGFVALVVVGPGDLPKTLRAIGRAIREFQRATRELRQDSGFDEVVDEIQRPLREGLSGLEEEVRSTVDDAKKSISLEAEGPTEAVDLAMEYPEGGPDDYGALPEGAAVYPETEGAP